MAAADYVIVGSGINALVAAALLGRKGHKVLLLERSDRIGGCIRTEEITAPGFVHDVMATTFVLFITSPAYAELGPELEKRGLGFAHTPTPTAVLLPDGRHAIFSMDRKTNIAAFEQLATGDGARFAADVDRVGAGGDEAFGTLEGAVELEGRPVVVERVRRAVDDPHDERPRRDVVASRPELHGAGRGKHDAAAVGRGSHPGQNSSEARARR